MVMRNIMNKQLLILKLKGKVE